MSTRSDIIVHCLDGKWRRIYCHSDGYLQHNGRILFDHYTGQKKVEKLVALGHISVLAREIGVKHPFDRPPYYLPGGTELKVNPAGEAYERKYGHMCRAYGRDRGEADIAADVGDTIQAVWPEIDTWTEFTYVWADANITERPSDPCWWVADPDKGTQDLVNLGDALQGKISVRPAVKAFGMILGRHETLDPKSPDHKWKSLR